MKSLINDAAHELALTVCRMVNLPDDQKLDLFREVFDAAKVQLAKYEEKATRRTLRLGPPSQN